LYIKVKLSRNPKSATSIPLTYSFFYAKLFRLT
jgi:hypothetical protein